MNSKILWRHIKVGEYLFGLNFIFLVFYFLYFIIFEDVGFYIVLMLILALIFTLLGINWIFGKHLEIRSKGLWTGNCYFYSNPGFFNYAVNSLTSIF